MSATTQTTRTAAATNTPHSEIDALLTEVIACIITGRPLPETVRPAPVAAAAVGSVAGGIGRSVGSRPA